MRIRIRSDASVIEIECDAYAVFDDDAALLLVSDHTLLEGDDLNGFEIVWIV